jgi:hypothetical protein
LECHLMSHPISASIGPIPFQELVLHLSGRIGRRRIGSQRIRPIRLRIARQ